MNVLNEAVAREAGFEKKTRPVRILQFGEGNFLRAFMDWMVDRMNNQGIYNGGVSIVQPLAQGMIGMLKDQDYLYTLFLRGIQNGEVVVDKKIIDAVERAVNPYEDFQAYLDEALNPDLRIIISNTTEAGIELREEDRADDMPPASYPGKLLVLMKKRYDHFEGDKSKGFLLFPCELIDRNGDNLKKVLLQLADLWYPEDKAFKAWLTEANVFFNTLVDRIVSGYPRDEVEELWAKEGYRDNQLDTGEIFHFLVVEGDTKYEKEFPIVQAGLNVKWCDDMTPYRTRKVRILNGAHTMTVLGAWLYGLETVKDCMDDEVLSAYVKKGIFEEIIPTLDLPADELSEYGGAILERFSNPYIKHFLLSISLNSVSKWKTRVMPSLLEYIVRKGELPRLLSFSLAALTLFYKGEKGAERTLKASRAVDGKEYEVNDSPEVLDFFASLWSGKTIASAADGASLMKEVLSKTDFWGQDLSEKEGLAELTGDFLYQLSSGSVKDVIGALVKE